MVSEAYRRGFADATQQKRREPQKPEDANDYFSGYSDGRKSIKLKPAKTKDYEKGYLAGYISARRGHTRHKPFPSENYKAGFAKGHQAGSKNEHQNTAKLDQ